MNIGLFLVMKASIGRDTAWSLRVRNGSDPALHRDLEEAFTRVKPSVSLGYYCRFSVLAPYRLQLSMPAAGMREMPGADDAGRGVNCTRLIQPD